MHTLIFQLSRVLPRLVYCNSKNTIYVTKITWWGYWPFLLLLDNCLLNMSTFLCLDIKKTTLPCVRQVIRPASELTHFVNDQSVFQLAWVAFHISPGAFHFVPKKGMKHHISDRAFFAQRDLLLPIELQEWGTPEAKRTIGNTNHDTGWQSSNIHWTRRTPCTTVGKCCLKIKKVVATIEGLHYSGRPWQKSIEIRS